MCSVWATHRLVLEKVQNRLLVQSKSLFRVFLWHTYIYKIIVQGLGLERKLFAYRVLPNTNQSFVQIMADLYI